MKKILKILLILMAVMPLANAASVSPELKDPWLPDDYIAPMLIMETDSNYYLVDPWDSHSAEEECAQAGGCEGYSSYKVDDWNQQNGMDGTYAGTITISDSTGYTFDWSSTTPVCKVIVVAGGVANVYSYPPNTMSDTGLVAPLNTNTPDLYDTFEISHVTFCYGNGGTQEIPEFPTVALPIAAILGLAFVFMRRK